MKPTTSTILFHFQAPRITDFTKDKSFAEISIEGLFINPDTVPFLTVVVVVVVVAVTMMMMTLPFMLIFI